jgi:hypothetical protein
MANQTDPLQKKKSPAVHPVIRKICLSIAGKIPIIIGYNMILISSLHIRMLLAESPFSVWWPPKKSESP